MVVLHEKLQDHQIIITNLELHMNICNIFEGLESMSYSFKVVTVKLPLTGRNARQKQTQEREAIHHHW